LSASPASAATTTCVGKIESQTIDSNLVVPPSAKCFLVNTTVNGNISVTEGASISFGIISEFPAVLNHVSGNVVAYQAASVSLAFSTVGGNVVATDSGQVTLDRVWTEGSGIFIGNESLSFHSAVFGNNLVCANNQTLQLFFYGADGHTSGQCAVESEG